MISAGLHEKKPGHSDLPRLFRLFALFIGQTHCRISGIRPKIIPVSVPVEEEITMLEL